jgi:hypothetical protein
LLEDSSGASFHGPITINPSHCRRLHTGDERAAPYPELLSQAAIIQQQATHPLRHALVDLTVAHASTTADFDNEIDEIIKLSTFNRIRQLSTDLEFILRIAGKSFL